jgi:hypothetical protein
MPPGMELGSLNIEQYSLSVFHQLHCVASLRDTIQSLRSGTRSKYGEHDHSGHCLDYLRQALMCAVDTTIEWPGSEEEEKLTIGPTNSNGVEHQCRDWDAVYRFAVDHRATDGKGILDA